MPATEIDTIHFLLIAMNAKMHSKYYFVCLLLLFSMPWASAFGQGCHASFYYAADLSLVTIDKAAYKSDKDLSAPLGDQEVALFNMNCQLAYRLYLEGGKIVRFIKFAEAAKASKVPSWVASAKQSKEKFTADKSLLPALESQWGMHFYPEQDLTRAVQYKADKIMRKLPGEQQQSTSKTQRTDPIALQLYIDELGNLRGIVFDERYPLAEQAKVRVAASLLPALDNALWKAGRIEGKQAGSVVALHFMLKWQYKSGSNKQRKVEAEDILSIALIDNYKLYEEVDKDARFPGGVSAYLKHQEEHIIYPEAAIKKKLEAVVLVRLVISPEGLVESADVVPGTEQGYGLDEEAVRVMMLTQWEPARLDGEAVRQSMVRPVKFMLPEDVKINRSKTVHGIVVSDI